MNTVIQRDVVCADTSEWLQQQTELPGSVFTSLPDISEISGIFHGKMSDKISQYESWFVNTAAEIMKLLPKGQYAIFLQSDVRMQNNDTKNVDRWIDKSFLCSTAASRSGLTLLWHKIAYISDIDARSNGRPNYSHLLCYGNSVSYNCDTFFVPDIFSRGEMLWSKGIGIDSCFMGVAFLRHVAHAKVVVDPFCGIGTVLAMANALGMSSVGVEISPKRCKKARHLDLSDMLSKLTPGRMSMLGLPRLDQPKFHKRNPNEEISSEINQNNDRNKDADIVHTEQSILRAIIPLTSCLLFHLSMISLAYICVSFVFDGMLSQSTIKQ